MNIFHDLFHSGIPYIVALTFFVAYTMKMYKILKKIEKNTRMSELSKVDKEKYGQYH